MVDFDKLRTRKKKEKPIKPTDIFRRLPKPPGINDLYTSQAEVLSDWFDGRNERDIVLKLHTGGGKTLVGLLIAQSSLNEVNDPVLYLTPTLQLVNQTLEKAKAHGIPAVPYEKGKPLSEAFTNGSAIMVATYKALFNGRSKFGLRGMGQPQKVSAIICDDAHVAFSVVRDSFTLKIDSGEDRPRYENLCGLFRRAFKEVDRLGTFDDILSGSDYGVIEVPYWAWHEQLDAVQEQLKSDAEKYPLIWPLLRDQLHLCHALISARSFSITPIAALVNAFPTFSDTPRRVYMSATIADDSEIVRTFDANSKSVKNALTSRSLAGISERMILVPDLMPFRFDVRKALDELLEQTTQLNFGAVILVSSNQAAEKWTNISTFAKGSREVEQIVSELQEGKTYGPVTFSNRYDGIDLPGNSCRLLVINGLPTGSTNYEIFRASALYDGSMITRILAQRIEQGMGRGARGAGDHCVVLLAGADLVAWVAKETNFSFLTSATRAQLEMGTEISKEVEDQKDLVRTIQRSFSRDTSWTEYYAETVADLIDEGNADEVYFEQANVERKSFNLWHDGYHEKAISCIEKYLFTANSLDPQTRGWLLQMSARIASNWGQADLAEDLQRQAYAHNRNLLRPKASPPYRALPNLTKQADAIVRQIGIYRIRRGYLQSFENTVSRLHHESSANQFEQSLVELATMIGLTAERHDIDGQGPDVLWLFPSKVGLVIEAKSRKKEKNALTKEEHGQLLVAAEWFANNYSDYECVRVSVLPKNKATKAAVAGASHALTYEKISALVSDSRILLTSLCESQLSDDDLQAECNRLLAESPIHYSNIVQNYLPLFSESS